MPAPLGAQAAARPALWVEVAPPRGINPEPLLRRLAELRGKADAINLTDNAMAKVKMSGLAFAALIKARLGLAVVLNFSCRDRNLLALKSDLLGAAALGVDAVVAVTGDRIAAGEHAQARAVGEVDALGLLRVIGELNRGDTGEGKRALKTLPGLVAGAVANPNRKPPEREFELLERKARAGARFVITQPVFDPATARPFLARARACAVEVMLGILPIKREAMADYLRAKLTDLREAGPGLDRYRGLSEAQARRLSIEENLKLMRELAGEVAGFTIMSGGGPSLAIELALELDRWRRSRGQ